MQQSCTSAVLASPEGLDHVQGEGNGAFVQRVQQVIADELDVPIVELTMPQKAKLVSEGQSN